EFRKNVLALCGDDGIRWLIELPDLIKSIESSWSIGVQKPFPNIEYNFVAEARTDAGLRCVLKIAPPFNNREIFGEAKYLRTLAGEGSVALLREDLGIRAMLLERVIPGENLVK